jgi:hypothetical protein
MNSTYAKIESKLYGHLRFMVIAWSCALPIMYTLLIWLTTLCDEHDRNWLAVAIAPGFCALLALSSMWLCVRISLANTKRRFQMNNGWVVLRTTATCESPQLRQP